MPLEEREIHSLFVVLTLAACLSAGARVWPALKSKPYTPSLAAGAAAAYVFLSLIPEIQRAASLLGDRIHTVVLAGFVLLYLLEQRIGRGPRAAKSGRFAFETGISAVYCFLLVLVIGENLPLNAKLGAVYVLGLGLHLSQMGHGLSKAVHPREPWRALAVVAGVMLIGWWLHVLTDVPENWLGFLTALIAGFVCYRVFQGELATESGLRPWAFASAALTVTALHWIASP